MQTDPEHELEFEIELLRKIGAGDRRSFEILYDRFSAPLYAVAFRVLKNQEAAEDVLQDVFLHIWEKAPLFDPTRGKPLPWAVMLTRCKAIDRARAATRLGRLRDGFQQEVETAEQFDDRSSFDAVAAGDTARLVRQAMEKLPPEQRTALELAFLQSLTHVEIADRLGKPLGTVKAHIRRGMLKMRELLGPDLRD
jgi:RNA polymerase sigma-70 factor (ECF subfamily)